MNSPDYELIIVGGGPAGLSAGIYAARDRLKCLLIEKSAIGGQMINAEMVENYPGFPEGIPGYELSELMHKQAEKFGLKTMLAEVTGLEIQGKQKVVKTTEGKFTAKAVIIAGGSERQKLGVPGEKEFTGKGVSYCATCDAAFFKDVPVAVIGGGNSALIEALHLTKFASRVIIIHRRDQLRATPIIQEKALAEPKIEYIWNTVVDEIEGEDFVKRLKLKNVKTGEKSTLEVAGVFVSVGLVPNTGYLKDILKLDPFGYIITNNKLETDIPGIFAAGDIRYESGRQSIIAAGDGATAAIYAGRFISE
jgi:thioredoxin reductase (NADPH)